MRSEKISTILRARWVLPILTPPVSGGYVAIRGREIESIDTKSYGRAVRDLGHVALLPGFFNAHTHLEFSDLAAPLGSPGQPLPKWIGQVVGHRRAQAAALGDAFGAHRTAAVRQGINESLRSGVVALGEIATRGTPFPAYENSPLNLSIFYELLSLDAAKVPELVLQATEFLDYTWNHLSGWQAGISPHAPYTVSKELMQGGVDLAGTRNLPLCMHLAESPEELELLAAHRGLFRELLEAFGVWREEAIPLGTRPLDYLQQLARAWRGLVVHGNYLDDIELSFLAEQADRLTLVHCPRTHAYFGHPRFPLADHLRRGISLAIGTDSRASNPDLDFLAEIRFLAQRHPDVAPLDILWLATLGGAKSWGLDPEYVALAKGGTATLIAIEVSGNHNADPYEEILGGHGRVVGVMIDGQWAIEPPL